MKVFSFIYPKIFLPFLEIIALKPDQEYRVQIASDNKMEINVHK